MFGLDKLKSRPHAIEPVGTTVECPVRGCVQTVPRRRMSSKQSKEFMCPEHRIYISPSTFEYENELDNLLWKNEADLALLSNIKRNAKRESRMGHDNSEDALTWNVFRFLEMGHLLAGFLETLVKHSVENPEVFYWSYSQTQNNVWPRLKEARKEFETVPGKGSEPDLIIQSNGDLFFIEAKLTATNNTVLHSHNPEVQRKYEKGGNSWYQRVVHSHFRTVAVTDKKYELLRLWLLGSWIAHRSDLNFCLVNLVPSEREVNIEEIFRKHIIENSRRTFVRATWESIYQFILDSQVDTKDKNVVLRYFENKTIGYKNRLLQKAFSISH